MDSPSTVSTGKAIREGDARLVDFLLDLSVDQRAEDLQNRASQGL